MKQELRSFVVDNYLFGQKIEFSDDDSLQETGIIDSTGVLELIAFLEETYRVSIADDEILPENLDSINRLVRFLEKKSQAANLKEHKAGAVSENPGLPLGVAVS
jgi:acyl carrier protein